MACPPPPHKSTEGPLTCARVATWSSVTDTTTFPLWQHPQQPDYCSYFRQHRTSIHLDLHSPVLGCFRRQEKVECSPPTAKAGTQHTHRPSSHSSLAQPLARPCSTCWLNRVLLQALLPSVPHQPPHAAGGKTPPPKVGRYGPQYFGNLQFPEVSPLYIQIISLRLVKVTLPFSLQGGYFPIMAPFDPLADTGPLFAQSLARPCVTC